jgi:hypothetical protein
MMDAVTGLVALILSMGALVGVGYLFLRLLSEALSADSQD